MILRKPYAFIIKHFRFIHIILLVCLSFLVFTGHDISNLFSKLQKTSTYTYAGAASYVNSINYLVILTVVGLSGTLLWMLYKKKKPIILYLCLFVYSIALLICYMYLFSLLNKMVESALSADEIILGKDMSLIVTLPDYVFIFICLTRSVGFNLKKFNFSKDIEELNIADKDSEEFELLIGQNNYKYKRTIRRSLRELKYYLLENKLVLLGFGSLVLLFFVGYGVVYYNQYLKKMSEEDITSVNGITYAVRNSFITANDYNGKKVRNGSKFVVIDMTFFNSNQTEVPLDLNIITLSDGGLVYYPTQNYNDYFYDLGIPYIEGTKIKPNSNIDNTIIYEMPESVKSKNFVLRIQYEYDKSNINKIIPRYRKFNISAKNIDSKPLDSKVNLSESFNPNAANINPLALTITNYNIMDTYDSRYVTCKKVDECQSLSRIISNGNNGVNNMNTMLVLDYKGTMYDDAVFIKKFDTFNKIFENYCIVNYTIFNRTYSDVAKIVSNSDEVGKIFISVDRKIVNANNISLQFNFRNNVYRVPLK